MRYVVAIIVVLAFLQSCTPPPSSVPSPTLDKDTLKDYRLISSMRGEQFRSAAYLIDLRVNDAGEKYSINTELYFSGDSVGFYGRGYLGKGAFKGNIIDDAVTVYFNQQDEYFSGPLADIGSGAECSSPGEVLLVVMSLLTGKTDWENPDNFKYPSRNEVSYHSGRFEKTVVLDKKGFPESEKMIDPMCKDSIFIKYQDSNRKFPFYKVQNVLYYNELFEFRARGFVREQKYNIDIGSRKFDVNIPASASRIDSI